jgi:hypothetical protein
MQKEEQQPTRRTLAGKRMSKGDLVTSGMHIGIDFGARMAGNTVVCERRGSLFRFHRCAKDEDGDTWLRACVDELRPKAIYIDAPLSLPDAYFGRGTDHFTAWPIAKPRI